MSAQKLGCPCVGPLSLSKEVWDGVRGSALVAADIDPHEECY